MVELKNVKGKAYIEVSWSSLHANSIVLSSVKKVDTQSPLILPVGSKLLSAVLIPGDEITKQASEHLSSMYNMFKQADSTIQDPARIYIGLALADADDTSALVISRTPVGALAPMNTDNSYGHMRPSLTTAEGRNFADLGAPLWIDAWLCDTVGLFPDPQDNQRKGSYVNVLFHDFDKDVAIKGLDHPNGINIWKGLKDTPHTKQFFNDKLRFTFIYEYTSVTPPGNTAWGEKNT